MNVSLIDHLGREFNTGRGHIRLRKLHISWHPTGLLLTPTRFNPDTETRKLSERDLAPLQLSRSRAERAPNWLGWLLGQRPREVAVLHAEIRTLRGYRLRLQADCPKGVEARLEGLPWMQSPRAPSVGWDEMVALLEQLRGLGVSLARAVVAEPEESKPSPPPIPEAKEEVEVLEEDTRHHGHQATIQHARVRVAQDGSGDTMSLAEALDWVEPGGTITIGAGRYPQPRPIEIRHRVSIEAEEDAVLVGQASPAVIIVEGAEVELSIRGLTVTYDEDVSMELPGCGMRVEDAAVVLEGCTFKGGRRGVEISGGSGVTLRGVAKARVGSCAFAQNARHGFELTDSSVAFLRESRFEENGSAGVMVYGAESRVEIASCVSRGNDDGVKLSRAAQALIRDSACEGNQMCGVFAFGPVSLELQRVRCVGNRREGMAFGLGVEARLSHCVSRENRRDGVRIYDRAEVVATNNRSEDNGRHGIDVEAPAKAELTGNVVTGNRRYGIRVQQGADTTLEENVVEDNTAGNMAWA